MTVSVQHWDAFTLEPGKGNPAGIVLAAEELTDRDMQAVAKSVGFNDTAFVLSSTIADVRIRYFAPRREVELCGHATVAAFAALHRSGLLGDDMLGGSFKLETKAGVLPIRVEVSNGGDSSIFMTQGGSQFAKFSGTRAMLAKALGMAVMDFDPALPIVYGSTGRWTLVVPVKDLATLQCMRPAPAEFAAALIDMPTASIHSFCLETIDPHAQMHARHFSSPGSGTLEDAVTGTASGVLGAYYRSFIAEAGSPEQSLIVEQGYEVQREGTVQVWATKQDDHYDVTISGSACFVRDIEIARP